MTMPYKFIPASLALLAALGASALAQSAPLPALTPAVTPGAAAPGASDAPDIDPSSYVLAPFDQIDIDVQNQSDMHRVVTILQDGTLTYPVAGAVKASGMTAVQLTNLLAKKLSHRYNQPAVTVTVLQTHTRRISVTGAVKSPGQYDYRPGLRLLELIAACGGPTSAPEMTQATLVTDRGTRSTDINLDALLNSHDQSQNVTLAPGDQLLFSPKDPAKSTIHVVGQVNRPGDYGVVTNGATVLSMLTEAGGATGSAALSHAQILRHDSDKVETINLHALKYDLDDPAGKIRLTAGDTLLLPENNNKVYILGEVRSNTAMYIPDGETLTVTQALAEAGGPDNIGDKKNVGVIHHIPLKTGAVRSTLRVVNVQDLLKNQNNIQDVNLQPGDYVIVPTRHIGHSLGEYLGGVSSAAYSVVGLRAIQR